jgi:hypothetical protein
MYCSGCGQVLAPGQAFCPQCGRPSAGIVPPVPGLQYQLDNYAGKVRTLSVFWFVYAGLSLLLGFAGLAFMHAFLSGAPWMHGPWTNEPWSHGPFPPNFLGPALIHLAWAFLVVRALLAAVAGWGLMEHTQWGKIVAIVAAVLSLLKFPFGTALGIWTLVVLLGYRNSTLYEQL